MLHSYYVTAIFMTHGKTFLTSCWNILIWLSTDLACVLPCKFHLILIVLLTAFNCFALSSSFVLSRFFTVCILSAQHKTVPTRMRVVWKWQQQRWGLVDNSLFLALFELQALVPCIPLLDPPRVHMLTNHKGGWKRELLQPHWHYIKLFRTLLCWYLFFLFLCEQRGPCLKAGNAEMAKAFPKDMKRLLHSPQFVQIRLVFKGGENRSSIFIKYPTNTYLSNLTKARRTEGKKKKEQSYNENLKWLEQNRRHMKQIFIPRRLPLANKMFKKHISIEYMLFFKVILHSYFFLSCNLFFKLF